ncbi:hypothetical protein H6F61_08705 [Cyanobacteria bacterium FACHB-472]|nr:hypothetical protein [Cyanobacteria bacterium FACHB-472]
MAMPIRVNLSPGEWNSRLQKRSPPARTKGKLRLLKPAQAGFVCKAAVLTAKLKLTPMGNAMSLQMYRAQFLNCYTP